MTIKMFLCDWQRMADSKKWWFLWFFKLRSSLWFGQATETPTSDQFLVAESKTKKHTKMLLSYIMPSLLSDSLSSAKSKCLLPQQIYSSQLVVLCLIRKKLALIKKNNNFHYLLFELPLLDCQGNVCVVNTCNKNITCQ